MGWSRCGLGCVRPTSTRAWPPGCRSQSRAGPRTWQEIRELQARQRDSEASARFLRGGARPPTPQIVAFIEANQGDEFGVEPICTVLHLQGCRWSPSTYYDAKPGHRRRGRCVMVLTPGAGRSSGRQLLASMLPASCGKRHVGPVTVGRDQVARLMRAARYRRHPARQAGQPQRRIRRLIGIRTSSGATSPHQPNHCG